MATVVTNMRGEEVNFQDSTWGLDAFGHLNIKDSENGIVGLFAAGTWASAVFVEDE